MWFIDWSIDWFIDCSCVEHSNLYVKADNYKEAFDEYSKRRVYECPPDYGPKSNADHAADLVVKLDSVYEKFTVKELKVWIHQAGMNRAQLLSPVSAMFHLALEQWELKW